MDARKAAELAARMSYGKLLSYLASWSRDLAAAEDALSEAFASALETWTVSGVPAKPEAWLTTVARRKLIDRSRRKETERSLQDDVGIVLEDLMAKAEDGSDVAFKDERLKLLFVCAHPAIDEHTRTPLMLQTVLGIDAARIASAFVVSPASMGKKLVRAKAKIKAAGVPFEVPDAGQLPERLASVLEAIYAAYGSGWDNILSEDERLSSLTEEAIWLARLTVALLPAEPEVQGLLALMLFCESRRKARRTEDGNYVPLDEQKVELWDQSLLAEAEQTLFKAARVGRLGRFQLEAAIQSAHVLRRRALVKNWLEIVQLYEGLVRLYPTLGSYVGRAAAVMEALGASRGLELLEQIDPAAVADYQPYWALLGVVWERVGKFQRAKKAFQRASGLVIDEATRQYLLAKMKGCDARF